MNHFVNSPALVVKQILLFQHYAIFANLLIEYIIVTRLHSPPQNEDLGRIGSVYWYSGAIFSHSWPGKIIESGRLRKEGANRIQNLFKGEDFIFFFTSTQFLPSMLSLSKKLFLI